MKYAAPRQIDVGECKEGNIRPEWDLSSSRCTGQSARRVIPAR